PTPRHAGPRAQPPSGPGPSGRLHARVRSVGCTPVITTFASLTTMRVGGPVRQLHVATTSAEAVEMVRDADSRKDPLLVIGGGSNLVVGDAGWDGTVIRMAQPGFDIDGDRVVAGAGVEWDPLVGATVAAGLVGLEALSG